MLLFASLLPWLMFIVGVVLITTVLLRRSHRYFGRRRRAGAIDPPIVHIPRPEAPWMSNRHPSSPSIDRQEIELYELARDLTGRLDSKIAVLQQLIIQSDAKISELRRLIDELEKRG